MLVYNFFKIKYHIKLIKNNYMVLCKNSGHSVVKNLPTNAGDAGLITVTVISPREGNGNSLQYSCLGNPSMDRAAWRAKYTGLQKSQTQINDQTTTYKNHV